MIGELHITTLLGPRLSAGSSLATWSRGCGEKKPAWAGAAGLEMSIAWRPRECQAMKARWGVTVGLCDENEVSCCVSGSTLGRNASVFSKILYSPVRTGRSGSATLIRRAQPHGHPKEGSVNLPETSSVFSSKGRPGTGKPEWLSKQQT